MPQGLYKSTQVIEVTYQAMAATSGLTDVIMEIFDESGAKDVVNFADVTMTEIGSSGRYKGSFTPDAVGKWRVMIDSVTVTGKTIKDFDVVAHNVASVGDAVSTVDGKVVTVSGKVDTVDGKVDTAQAAIDALNNVSAAEVNAQVDSALSDYDAPTKAEIDASESSIRGADSDTLKTLSDQLDGIAGSVAPPMIG